MSKSDEVWWSVSTINLNPTKVLATMPTFTKDWVTFLNADGYLRAKFATGAVVSVVQMAETEGWKAA